MLRLALTPKWIAALIGCIALGVVFALLAQWQASRSYVPTPPTKYSKIVFEDLNQQNEPGLPFNFQEVDSKTKVLTEVEAKVKFNTSKAVLVNKRLQSNADSGVWIVVPAETAQGRLMVAVGFSSVSNADQVLQAVKSAKVSEVQLVRGRYLPSEAPLQMLSNGSLDSMSVAQLINLSPGNAKTYAGFLALTNPSIFSDVPNLEVLKIDLAKTDSGLNWLTTFYALEWTFFALFALFMWWRLLADAFKKEQQEMLSASK